MTAKTDIRRGRGRAGARSALGASTRLGLAILCGWIVVGAASAETIPLEVVGVQPLGAGPARGAPKEKAIQEALWEGVRRVARDLLLDNEYVDPEAADGGESGADGDGASAASNSADPARLRQALGKDIVPYTRGFKIVEDRGVQPALFSEDPEVETEYVVVVEVQVDQGNVRRALEAAGLLSRSRDPSSLRAVPLEVLGLVAYPGLEALQALLLGPIGAKRVSPVGFERGRAVLRVEGDFEAAELRDRLASSRTPGLALTPLSSDPERVRVRATWTPPDPALSDASRRSR